MRYTVVGQHSIWRWALLLMIVCGLYACRSDSGNIENSPNSEDINSVSNADPGDATNLNDNPNSDPNVIDNANRGEPICTVQTHGPRWDDATNDYVADNCYCDDDGPGWLSDLDQDGLSDCDELVQCTNPFNHDSDGDGISDLEEIRLGLDPCNADSDGDGLDDGKELRFGLDPLNESTFNDGILDADRWIVDACDDQQSEYVVYHSEPIGEWVLALPGGMSTTNSVVIDGATTENRQALLTYSDIAYEVSGGVFSTHRQHDLSAIRSESLEEKHLYYRDTIRSVAAIAQDSISAPFTTHDFREAIIARYHIRTSEPQSVAAIRDALLSHIAPFSIDPGADSSAGSELSVDEHGNPYQSFRIMVSIVRHADIDLTLLVVAPAQKYDENDKLRFRMEDLVSTTNISLSTDLTHERCTTFNPGVQVPQADFYWVLDQSGSMGVHYDRVQNVAAHFFEALKNSQLDYRLGVTNMAESGLGRLRVPPGWHRELSVFLNEIDSWVVQCQGCLGSYNLEEWGLTNMQKGIDYMRAADTPHSDAPHSDERIRPNAQLITIIMADEEPQSVQNYPSDTVIGRARLDEFLNYLPGQTTVYAIVSQGWPCGDDTPSYRELAQATGGAYYDLCAEDIEETIEAIMYETSGKAATYRLPDTPIASSLRIFKNGQWVPRSRVNGFDYFPNSNSVAFFGSFRPISDSEQLSPEDYLTVAYSYFVTTSKE